MNIQPFRIDGLSCCLYSNQQNSSLENNNNLPNILCSSKSIAVICHGLLSSKNSKIIKGLAEGIIKLSKENTCVITFDFRGNGESEGSTSYGNYQEEADDLNTVLTNITTNAIESSLKKSSIMIIGHSKGAAVVLIALNNSIEYLNGLYLNVAIVCVSGRFYFDTIELNQRFTSAQMVQLETEEKFVWRKYSIYDKDSDSWIEKDYIVTKEDYQRRRLLNIEAVCKSLKGKLLKERNRILFTHGDQDKVIPIEDLHGFGQVFGMETVAVLKGGGHFYSKQSELEWLCFLINGRCR